MTVLVRFDRDALNVNPGRVSMTMPERVLSLAEGPRALGHHPSEDVARLAQMNLADPASLAYRFRFSTKDQEESSVERLFSEELI